MAAIEVDSSGETLAWGRAQVVPAMRAAVNTLPVSIRHIAGYHLGWWDEYGSPERAAPGKSVRPALALLSAAVVGGLPREALPAAVAVELVHNFSLLHDDVMDADVTRRHRPTVWRLFGTGAAILAGDALLALALDVLATSGHPASGQATRVLSVAVQDLIEGQGSDLAFERRNAVGLEECERMAAGKTAALIGCACALGALLGGADDEWVLRMRTFGERVGLAYQHVDDLLGIWGDPAATGKPVYSDLRSRKKTLPVVAALASGTPAGQELARRYAAGPLPVNDLVHVASLVDAAGGRAWSQTKADELLAEAVCQLDTANPDPATGELVRLARLMTRRDS